MVKENQRQLTLTLAFLSSSQIALKVLNCFRTLAARPF